MQTYTNNIATDLTEADLPTMGGRLNLPDGWRYKSTMLDRDLVIDTKVWPTSSPTCSPTCTRAASTG